MEMLRYNATVIVVLSLLLGTVVAEKGMEAVAVIMKFESGIEQNIIGVVNFQQKDCTETVYIHVNISGLPPGKHGFHIHDKGDLTNGCTSTGAHFNPHNSVHGGPNDPVRHAGDLGNIDVKDNGMADTVIMDKAVSLFGAQGIVGRAVVIHAMSDDLGKGGNIESKKTGNAGSRIACGVIGIKSDISVWPCTRSAAPLAQVSWCLLPLALAFQYRLI